jgi:nucleoside-diphosphate-sugar epimerase
MSPTRRDFFRSAAAAGGAFALGVSDLAGAVPGAATSGPEAESRGPEAGFRSEARLDILILGGTGFIGPHEIRYARARGHNVTMFNRGRTNPELFPDIERLIGDRDDQLDSLRGRRWDVVIDNSGFYPRHARLSAELLEPSVHLYLFVSSISAYSSKLQPRQDEHSAPYATMDDPTDESAPPYGPGYGARKALSEQEIERVFGPERTVIVRPGVITGPGDPTDRIRHWLARVDRGGEVLVPGSPADPVQYIDARDLTAWMVRLLEEGTSGRFNGVGPAHDMTMSEMVHGLAATSSKPRSFTWVDEAFLTEYTVEGRSIVGRYSPWVPTSERAFMMVDNDAAMASGLTYMPFADTAAAMYEEYRTVSTAGYVDRYGWRNVVSSEVEAEVLAAWRAQG